MVLVVFPLVLLHVFGDLHSGDAERGWHTLIFLIRNHIVLARVSNSLGNVGLPRVSFLTTSLLQKPFSGPLVATVARESLCGACSVDSQLDCLSLGRYLLVFRVYQEAIKRNRGREPARSTGNCRFYPEGFILQAVWLKTCVFRMF